MTPEAKTELIKVLINDKHSGFTTGDEKMLESASDERLESFRVAAGSRAATDKDLRAAAAKKYTTEEFMAAAPPELRSLIDRQQKQETELKAALITELKACQNEYSEAELSVKPVEELARMARMAKVPDTKIDYSGRGLPRSLAKNDGESYAPPDPYAKDITALQSRTTH